MRTLYLLIGCKNLSNHWAFNSLNSSTNLSYYKLTSYLEN